MRSASERFPRERTLLHSWVTSTDRYTGSGTSSRRGGGPLRGNSGLLLGAVAATSLGTVAHAGGVQSATHDLVTNTREVLHPAAAHQNDRVLLQVVADSRNVRSALRAAGQPHARNLAERWVRVFRSRR